MEAGRALSFEGIDGSGKTTLIYEIEAWLNEKGQLLTDKKNYPPKVVVVPDPGGSRLGQEIRRIVTDDIGSCHPWVDALLFCAARVENLHRIIMPNLRCGAWVLMDRFVDSTLAYQGYGQGLDIQSLREIHMMTMNGFYPHLTFVLDCPLTVAEKRMRKRLDKKSRWEMGASFLERVRLGYLELATEDPKRYIVLDATKSPKALLKEVIDIFNKAFVR